MIDREQWAEIYDWARYNGFSPLTFIIEAMGWKYRKTSYDPNNEELVYATCREFSIDRTDYPKEHPHAS